MPADRARRGYVRAVAEIPAGASGTASGVKLWAVSITDVRGLFHPTSDVADKLRSDVPFHVLKPYKQSWFWPLLKRDPGAPVLAPDSPLPSDVDNLLHGHFVPPDNLVPSWQIVSHWLDVARHPRCSSASTTRPRKARLSTSRGRALASHFALPTWRARDAALLPLGPMTGSGSATSGTRSRSSWGPGMAA